jgi:hypothetical protein
MTITSLPRIALVMLAALLGTSGCVTANLKLISAGHTGCKPEDLTISNVQGFGQMWNATCNGKTYLCTGASSGKNSVDYSCALAQ